MKKLKDKGDKFLVLAAFFDILIIGGTVTYAYYQSTRSGTITGSIAKWSFKANDEVSTFDLDLGSLYPGLVRTYTIELSAEDSNLDVYYEIMFNLTSTASACNYLHWDSAYTSKVGRCANHPNYPGTYGQYGIIEAGTTKTITFYYNWYYNAQQSYITDRDQYSVTIYARQYTGYNGSIPIKIAGSSYTYTSETTTSGWINKNC